MMTVITHSSLKSGGEKEWDQAMRERLDSASDRPGWISGLVLIPENGQNRRVIVGTWSSRSDWEAWHQDPAFKDTRERMEGLQEQPDEMQWYEVVTHGDEPG
jgi:heme-degrading monooxygenase HmoA